MLFDFFELIKKPDIFQMVIWIGVLNIGLFLAYLQTYFKEKAKRMALKDDIEEVTELVEGVKSKINFITQAKLSFRQEERDALVNYYESYHSWLHLILETSFISFNYNNYEEKYILALDELQKAKLRYFFCEGRLNLFVNKPELDSLIGEITKNVLEIHNLFSEEFYEHVKIFNIINDLNKIEPEEARFKMYKECNEDRLNIAKEFNDKRIEMYKSISPLNRTIQVYINKHLKTLIEG